MRALLVALVCLVVLAAASACSSTAVETSTAPSGTSTMTSTPTSGSADVARGSIPGTTPALAPVYRTAQLVPRGTSWNDALANGAIVADEIPAEFRPDKAVTPDRQPTGVALFDLAVGTVIVVDMFAG